MLHSMPHRGARLQLQLQIREMTWGSRLEGSFEANDNKRG